MASFRMVFNPKTYGRFFEKVCRESSKSHRQPILSIIETFQLDFYPLCSEPQNCFAAVLKLALKSPLFRSNFSGLGHKEKVCKGIMAASTFCFFQHFLVKLIDQVYQNVVTATIIDVAKTDISLPNIFQGSKGEGNNGLLYLLPSSKKFKCA